MNTDNIIKEKATLEPELKSAVERQAAAGQVAASTEKCAESHGGGNPQREAAGEMSPQLDEVQHLLEELGVSESIAASARVIVQSLREGNTSNANLVNLVVQALRHDEDLKNAETQGYLRGRNEVIEAATTPPGDNSSRPLNFPIYAKRSFWEK